MISEAGVHPPPGPGAGQGWAAPSLLTTRPDSRGVSVVTVSVATVVAAAVVDGGGGGGGSHDSAVATPPAAEGPLDSAHDGCPRFASMYVFLEKRATGRPRAPTGASRESCIERVLECQREREHGCDL